MKHRGEELKWEWHDGFYFAHTSYGVWVIEQFRGKFLIRLSLEGTKEDQDFGSAPTSAKAQAAAKAAHKAILKGGMS